MVNQEEANRIKGIIEDLHSYQIFGSSAMQTSNLNNLLGYTAYHNTKIQYQQQLYNKTMAFTAIAVAALVASQALLNMSFIPTDWHPFIQGAIAVICGLVIWKFWEHIKHPHSL